MFPSKYRRVTELESLVSNCCWSVLDSINAKANEFPANPLVVYNGSRLVKVP